MIKTSGIVLRVFDYSETSQVAYLCTEGHGQVHLLAKGSRRKRKDGRGPFSLLDQCQVVYIRRAGGGLCIATDWLATRVYRRLREDLGALYAALFAAELTLATTHEEEDGGEYFKLLEGFLAALNHGRDPDPARLRFEVGLLDALGLLPEFTTCAECGRSLGRMARFSAAAGGAVCSDCGMADAEATGLSQGSLAALRRLADRRAGEARVVLSAAQTQEIDRALKDHFEYQLGRPLRTAGHVVRTA